MLYYPDINSIFWQQLMPLVPTHNNIIVATEPVMPVSQQTSLFCSGVNLLARLTTRGCSNGTAKPRLILYRAVLVLKLQVHIGDVAFAGS